MSKVLQDEKGILYVAHHFELLAVEDAKVLLEAAKSDIALLEKTLTKPSADAAPGSVDGAPAPAEAPGAPAEQAAIPPAPEAAPTADPATPPLDANGQPVTLQ